MNCRATLPTAAPGIIGSSTTAAAWASSPHIKGEKVGKSSTTPTASAAHGAPRGLRLRGTPATARACSRRCRTSFFAKGRPKRISASIFRNRAAMERASSFCRPTRQNANSAKNVVESSSPSKGSGLSRLAETSHRPDAADIGPSARACEPAMEQLFIASGNGVDQDALERQLFIIRKLASHRLRAGKERLKSSH
jgi:hypothetical protein